MPTYGVVMRGDRHGRGSREIYTAANFAGDFHDAVERIKAVWGSALTDVVFGYLELPDVNARSSEIPLGKVEGNTITIYRLPIQLRVLSAAESAQLIFDTVVEQVAEFLNLEPSEVHEDYGAES